MTPSIDTARELRYLADLEAEDERRAVGAQPVAAPISAALAGFMRAMHSARRAERIASEAESERYYKLTAAGRLAAERLAQRMRAHNEAFREAMAAGASSEQEAAGIASRRVREAGL